MSSVSCGKSMRLRGGPVYSYSFSGLISGIPPILPAQAGYRSKTYPVFFCQRMNAVVSDCRGRNTAPSLPCSAHRFIRMKINFLVIDASPEPLDKHVIPPTSFAVHAGPDVMSFQQFGKFLAGELTARVRIEKILGHPYRTTASSTASTQKSAVSMSDSHQDSALRLA